MQPHPLLCARQTACDTMLAFARSPHLVCLYQVVQGGALESRAGQHQAAADHWCSKVQPPAATAPAARSKQCCKLRLQPQYLEQAGSLPQDLISKPDCA